MDKELILKAKEGDKAAKEEILRLFKPLVVSCANNVFISGYDRSDLIQMGYLSVLKAVDSYDITSDSFAGYINNAVKNNYYYLIRRKARLRYESELDEEAISDDNIEDDVFCNMDIEELKCALEKLSAKDRTLIEYLFFKGYKLRECEVILKVSKSTISRRKEQILKKLRVYLKESTPGPGNNW